MIEAGLRREEGKIRSGVSGLADATLRPVAPTGVPEICREWASWDRVIMLGRGSPHPGAVGVGKFEGLQIERVRGLNACCRERWRAC